MTSARSLTESLSVTVENVGGIDETYVELSEGVTVLKGRNATNRTSFLQALMASMGSDRYTLKGDADEGRVELEFGDKIVERRFKRRNGSVAALDDGYLDAPDLADLFAFLDEENDARRAVARSDNLHEVIMRPIDTNEIEAEIERLQATKRSLDEQLECIDERANERPALRDRKESIEAEIERTEAELAEVEAEIEDANVDVDSERESQDAVERDLDALTDRRSELDEIRFQIETLEETIDSLEAERESKRDHREDITVDPDTELNTLKSDLQDLRDRQRRVTAQTSELQSIIQFNENMLDGTDSEIASVLRTDDDGSGSVTDRLLDEDESVVCWTCGSVVDEDDIESTLSSLRSYRQEKFSERKSIESEINDLQERISTHEQAERELDEVNERLAEIDVSIDQKRDRIDNLEARREELHEEIESLEAAVQEEKSSNYSKILELHKEANELELKLEQRENELSSVEDDLEEIDTLLEEREEYEQRREQIVDELRDLRNHIDRIEEDVIEAFNDHMAEVLDVLEYDNLARVWIDCQQREVRDGRRKVDESYFELHIVRETESGSTYEGTVETLSESEREVVGLVFALAGYLVHDVHETVPVMLLDSLEAIDTDRIARLVEYFADFPDFLVVALLPEDTSAIDLDHETIHEI